MDSGEEKENGERKEGPARVRTAAPGLEMDQHIESESVLLAGWVWNQLTEVNGEGSAS